MTGAGASGVEGGVAVGEPVPPGVMLFEEAAPRPVKLGGVSVFDFAR
jgi:hypothetical protein